MTRDLYDPTLGSSLLGGAFVLIPLQELYIPVGVEFKKGKANLFYADQNLVLKCAKVKLPGQPGVPVTEIHYSQVSEGVQVEWHLGNGEIADTWVAPHRSLEKVKLFWHQYGDLQATWRILIFTLDGDKPSRVSFLPRPGDPPSTWTTSLDSEGTNHLRQETSHDRTHFRPPRRLPAVRLPLRQE